MVGWGQKYKGRGRAGKGSKSVGWGGARAGNKLFISADGIRATANQRKSYFALRQVKLAKYTHNPDCYHN